MEAHGALHLRDFSQTELETLKIHCRQNLVFYTDSKEILGALKGTIGPRVRTS